MQGQNVESTGEGEAGGKICKEEALRITEGNGQMGAEGMKTDRGREGRTQYLSACGA